MCCFSKLVPKSQNKVKKVVRCFRREMMLIFFNGKVVRCFRRETMLSFRGKVVPVSKVIPKSPSSTGAVNTRLHFFFFSF